MQSPTEILRPSSNAFNPMLPPTGRQIIQHNVASLDLISFPFTITNASPDRDTFKADYTRVFCISFINIIRPEQTVRILHKYCRSSSIVVQGILDS
jgi:hypothetical protein